MRQRRHGILSVAAAAAAAGLASSASANPYAGEVSVSGTTASYYLNQAADSVVVTTGPGGTGTVLQTLSGAAAATAGQHTFNYSGSGGFYITVNQNTGSGFLNPNGTNNATLVGTPVSVAAGRGIAVDQNPGSNFGRIYATSSGAGIIAQNSDQSAAFGFNNAPQTAGLPAGASGLPWQISVGPDSNVYIGDTSSAWGNIYKVAGDLSGSAALFGGSANGGFSSTSNANATANNHGESTSKPLASFDASGNLIITATDAYLDVGGAGTQYNAINAYKIPAGQIPALSNPIANQGPVPTVTMIANPGSNATVAIASYNGQSGFVQTDIDRGRVDGRYYYVDSRANGTAAASFYVADATGKTVFDSLVASGGATASNGGTLTGQGDKLTAVNSVAVSPDNKYVAMIVGGTPNAGTSTNVPNDVIVLPLDYTDPTSGATGLPDLAKEIYIPNAFVSDTGNGRAIAFDAAGNIYAISSGAGQYVILSPGGDTSYTTGFDGANYSFVANAVPEPAALALLSLGALGLMRRRKPRRADADGADAPTC